MITASETIPPFPTYHTILTYVPEESVFFDIETTGFSPASSTLFLIGAIYYENGQWTLAQWLAESAEDEAPLLAAFFETIKNRKLLIHFNGSTFDLPYVKRKAAALSVENPLDHLASLDLYQSFRPLKKLLDLERMNQSSLEACIGWHREDRLTGKHMVSLFQKYAASHEPGLEQLLLLHNHDDLLGMVKILSLAAYVALLDGKFSVTHPVVEEAAILHHADSCPADHESVQTSGQSDSAQVVTIHFQTGLELPRPLVVQFSGSGSLSLQKKEGTLRIPCFCGKLFYFFPDYKNYYYLPLEDQAIHKSVAAYVDKQYRIPATPANCYTRKAGVFLWQPKELVTPVFRPREEPDQLYFEYSAENLVNTAFLREYICYIIKKAMITAAAKHL